MQLTSTSQLPVQVMTMSTERTTSLSLTIRNPSMLQLNSSIKLVNTTIQIQVYMMDNHNASTADDAVWY